MSLLFKTATHISRKVQSMLGMSTLGARAIVINDDNQILLVKHTYQPLWYIPGGGVKRGESVRAAILRELKEEVGITVTNEPELFGVYYHVYLGVDDYPVIYIVKHFTQSDVQSPEIEAHGWFDLDNLPEETSPGTLRRLREYFSKVAKSETW